MSSGNVIGRTISHYRVLRELGSGGMGVVYEAEDTRLHRRVALKFLSDSLSSDSNSVKRFLREARAASAFNHANVCTIYEVEEADGRPFIAMELLEGETLKDRIGRGRLPVSELLDVAIQTAGALEAAHRHGIVHRDIKPGNIFIQRDGSVRLVDFGLAKLMADLDETAPYGHETALTIAGEIPGTATYVSPEQARGEPIDQRADLFSLGVVLYEMASGQKPFLKKNRALTLEAIMNRHPVALHTIEPSVPPEVEGIVEKALEKDPVKRYQSAADVRADLESLRRTIHGGDLPVSMESRALPLPSRLREQEQTISRLRHGKKSPLLLGALAIAVIALVTFVIYRFALRPAAKIMVAVLPLEERGSSAGQEYFTEGLTDDLITQLGSVNPERLGVIARSSSMRFRESTKTPKEIGRELGVAYLVEGTVRRNGGHVRVDAQLVKTRDETSVWTHQYDRQASDILTLQSELAQAIASAIQLQLASAGPVRASAGSRINPAAYEAYVRGRHEWADRTAESLRRAVDDFEQAIALDPNQALPYAGLADAWLSLGYYVLPPTEAMPKSEEAARKAVALDGSLAEAHTSLAYILFHYDFDWAGSEREFRRAIQLNPSYPTAHQWYAEYLASAGRVREAEDEARRAQQLDPLSPGVNSGAALAMYLAGDMAGAINGEQKTLQLDPNFLPAHLILGEAYLESGRSEAAIAQFRKGLQLAPDNPLFRAALAYALAVTKNYLQASPMYDELERAAGSLYISAYQLALIQLAFGERDRAFDLLDGAYQERSAWLPYLAVDPKLRPLRGDERFKALMKRVGLE
ncbi:MAG: protein kinase [Acidobacteria bacterium]|nr:protein kinase [Acidobacteriota bacterium]